MCFRADSPCSTRNNVTVTYPSGTEPPLKTTPNKQETHTCSHITLTNTESIGS